MLELAPRPWNNRPISKLFSVAHNLVQRSAMVTILDGWRRGMEVIGGQNVFLGGRRARFGPTTMGAGAMHALRR